VRACLARESAHHSSQQAATTPELRRGLLVGSLRFAPGLQEKLLASDGMAGGGGGRDLPSTPTWAVAVVCAVIVLVSVAMEHGLHKLGHVRSFRMRACLTLGKKLSFDLGI